MRHVLSIHVDADTPHHRTAKSQIKHLSNMSGKASKGGGGGGDGSGKGGGGGGGSRGKSHQGGGGHGTQMTHEAASRVQSSEARSQGGHGKIWMGSVDWREQRHALTSMCFNIEQPHSRELRLRLPRPGGREPQRAQQ